MNGLPSVNLSNVNQTLIRGLQKSTPNVQAPAETGNLFSHLVEKTNADQINSDNAIQDFIEQKPGTSVQQVVMAVAEAEMSFQFFMEVRNQLIDSYNELMRMQF
ncbi:MAG: flagellar hook-basal body complex protein FliE [Planctomycetota bacterium]